MKLKMIALAAMMGAAMPLAYAADHGAHTTPAEEVVDDAAAAAKDAAKDAPATAPAEEVVEDAGAAAQEAADEAAITTAAAYANAVTTANLYEIEAANIAWERSKSEEVKAFAKMLIADHTASNAKLKVLVEQMDGSVPDSLDDAHRAKIDALNDAEETAFDATYLDQQVAAHEGALKIHKGYAAGGDNDGFKTFAKESSKTVAAHLKDAKKLGGKTAM